MHVVCVALERDGLLESVADRGVGLGQVESDVAVDSEEHVDQGEEGDSATRSAGGSGLDTERERPAQRGLGCAVLEGAPVACGVETRAPGLRGWSQPTTEEVRDDDERVVVGHLDPTSVMELVKAGALGRVDGPEAGVNRGVLLQVGCQLEQSAVGRSPHPHGGTPPRPPTWRWGSRSTASTLRPGATISRRTSSVSNTWSPMTTRPRDRRPLRPRQPVHVLGLRPPAARGRAARIHGPRRLQRGQLDDRVLLVHHAARAPRTRTTWETPEQLGAAIFEWIEAWYNPRRRHTALEMLSPIDYEHHWKTSALHAATEGAA